MAHDHTCPLCRGPLKLHRSAPRLNFESRLRSRFVNSRLGHAPQDVEAMDLTRFMHGEPARLLACLRCGLLIRDESHQSHYADDRYDPALLNHLYPRYLQAFDEKRPRYQPFLRPGAEVLEVGSHLGAFLEAAENWGWRPIGLDVGAVTSTFANKKGAFVLRTTLSDYSPPTRRPEAIFIWNCFEQLENPVDTLISAHRLLDRHGLIVLRVPNAGFYLDQTRNPVFHDSASVTQALAYNNLLAFPYRLGYRPNHLSSLLRNNGFVPEAIYGATLLTPPYPELSPRLKTEWRKRKPTGPNPAQAPWIEIAARRISE